MTDTTVPAPQAETAVLDDAHVGDIEGALGTVSMHDTRAATDVGPPAADARGDRRARADRHDRRQRRRRRVDVRAGRPAVRHDAAVESCCCSSRC